MEPQDPPEAAVRPCPICLEHFPEDTLQPCAICRGRFCPECYAAHLSSDDHQRPTVH